VANVISSNDYAKYNKQKGYTLNSMNNNNQLHSSPKPINIVEGNQITLGKNIKHRDIKIINSFRFLFCYRVLRKWGSKACHKVVR